MARYSVRSESGQVVHTACAYPFFHSMDEVPAHYWVTLAIKFSTTHLYTWERNIARILVMCLIQEHNLLYIGVTSSILIGYKHAANSCLLCFYRIIPTDHSFYICRIDVIPTDKSFFM